MYVWIYVCLYVCIYEVRILLSAEEDNLSPLDSNIACLCQSIEINNNKHIYIYTHIYIIYMYMCTCTCLYIYMYIHWTLWLLTSHWENGTKCTPCAGCRGMLCHQVKSQPPFEVHLADWPWTPLGVCANLLRGRRSCRSYNFKVKSMEILNTRTDIRVFPRTFDYFSTMWDVGWFYQDHTSRVNAKLQKIYQYFVGKNRKRGRKTTFQRTTYRLYIWKVVRKSNVRQVRYNDKLKSLKCSRLVPPSRWYGPDRLPMEVRSQHDKTYELFLTDNEIPSFPVSC